MGLSLAPPRAPFGEHLAPGLPGQPDPDGENVELSSSFPARGAGPGRRGGPPGVQGGSGAVLEGFPRTFIFESKKVIIFLVLGSRWGVLFGTLSGHRRYARCSPTGVLFGALWGGPARGDIASKTCNCSQVYCSFAPELGPKRTSISGHLLGDMGDVRGVILDVIFDVIWIYFGRHFGDPGGDPAGAAWGTSGRVVEITSSTTWCFA